ncbi:TPA: hypothetical protein SIF56_004485 [Escherichia coli]|nr:hypothetical protein [Escherichia coli]
MKSIYRKGENHLGEEILEQAFLEEGQVMTEGWTEDLESLDFKVPTAQNEVNAKITKELLNSKIDSMAKAKQIKELTLKVAKLEAGE